jgi:UDP-N-acetylglucosamine 2-epimerase (non-hydrolysing)
MACTLVAAKVGVKVAHVEAGLRSFDRTMPEEINRIVTDALAGLLFVTEESGARNLEKEGIPANRVRVVGNLMIDSLYHHLAQARSSGIVRTLGAEPPFGLVTLHRPANVDDPGRLGEIVGALQEIAGQMPLYFPVHPRTRERLAAGGISVDSGIRVIEPLGYLDFLCLMSHSSVVLTDSGGIQEETTALGIPCLTLRENTERPITIEEGTNLLAGTSRGTIVKAWEEMRSHPKAGRVPKYWDGHAAGRCQDALAEFFGV